MNTRPFGKTGFQTSEIGLGCRQLGGSDWGSIDDARAMDILGAAVDAGVNFLDTADVYGDGRSEELIGRFLKGRSAHGSGMAKRSSPPGLWPRIRA
jgi:aryl-alcohol dehydrogenase-like predicted oxidoreductase